MELEFVWLEVISFDVDEIDDENYKEQYIVRYILLKNTRKSQLHFWGIQAELKDYKSKY